MSTGAYTTWFVYYIYYMAYIYAFTKICPSGHESWRMTCNIYTTHFVYYIYDSSIFRMKTFSSYKFYMYTIPDLYLLVRRRGFSWSEESIHSPPSRTKWIIDINDLYKRCDAKIDCRRLTYMGACPLKNKFQ